MTRSLHGSSLMLHPDYSTSRQRSHAQCPDHLSNLLCCIEAIGWQLELCRPAVSEKHTQILGFRIPGSMPSCRSYLSHLSSCLSASSGQCTTKLSETRYVSFPVIDLSETQQLGNRPALWYTPVDPIFAPLC